MKKNLTLFLFLFILQFAFAQTQSNYWILFKDKNASPYSVSQPSAYLSEKSIERRKKQNIVITSSDLPVNPNYINAVRSIGVNILNQSKWFNAILVSTSDATTIDAIKALPYVREVRSISIPQRSKVDSKFELENNSIAIPNERSASATTTAALNYGSSFKQAHQIGVDCLHNLGFQGQGMTIASLDDGFYKVDSLPAFDTLRVNGQILGTHNYVNTSSVYLDINDSHGMNTLSCIGGNLPGRLVGTAPRAKFWLLETENFYSESLQEEINWLHGAEFADSVGVDIITSSLGYSTFDNAADNHTYADLNGRTTIISKAAVWAARKGIFVTIAAGNAGGPPWYKITAPGDADSVLTVGAVDSLGNVPNFSSRGPSADGRIKPNTAARGVKAVVASQYGDILMESGTSFSTPITAGAVACLWQAHPTATVIQLIDAIQQSASQAISPDSIMGYGIPNFCTASQILTGIDENKLTNENLKVYPNPFSSTVQISFYSDKKQTIEIELFDISGRRLVSQTKILSANSNDPISISEIENLANGIYIVQLRTSERNYFKKIIKNKS